MSFFALTVFLAVFFEYDVEAYSYLKRPASPRATQVSIKFTRGSSLNDDGLV